MRIPSSLRASRAERWARLRRSLWQPPRAHGDQPRERVVGPLDLPLTAAVAAMGAAMVSLVDHAHDGRTPVATAWVLSAGAAAVLVTAMLLAASLPAWEDDRGLYRPLARTCGAAAVACLGVGAARPTPLVLGLALVVLLSIPWGLAVARRLASGADSPGTPQAWRVPAGEPDFAHHG